MWVPITPGCIGLSRSPAEVRAIIPLVFHEDNVAFYVTAFLQNLLIGAAPGLPCVEPSKLLPSREGGTRWIGVEGRWALNTTEVHQFRGPGFPAGSVWFCTDLRSLLISLVKDDSNIAVHFLFYATSSKLFKSNFMQARRERNAFVNCGSLFVPVSLAVLITLAAMCAWLSQVILL